ncbi:MAG: ribonuclease H-like domain-containing protein [Cellulosilyticaceae bacterium]
MLPPDGSCLLDLETTGLSKDHDQIVCIGFYCTKTNQIVQKTCSKDFPEQDLLVFFSEQLASCQTLYVYQNFDIDFLCARLHHHGLPIYFLQQIKVITLRKTPFFKRLKSCGYETRDQIESALGYVRQTQTSGRNLAKLGKLLIEQSAHCTYASVLKAHNQEELLGLTKLYLLYRFVMSLTRQVPVGSKLTESVTLEYSFTLTDSLDCFFDFGPLTLAIYSDTLTLSFKAEKLTLRRYLYPAKDYVYIPSERQIIHKSIAQFFPSSMKEKVSQARCFLTQEHLALSLLQRSKEQRTQWVDADYRIYLPLDEVTDFTQLHQKACKYLTQG